MSVHEQEPGVFQRLQLRSATPGPNEKVLSFLEGIAQSGEELDMTPPRSMVDPDEYRRAESVHSGGGPPPVIYSPAPRSKASDTLINPGLAGFPYSPRNAKLNGHLLEVERGRENEDVESNVQDGVRSELGEPVREPGPNDPPGPKYESYDSGPSFGNFGPLPQEGTNPYARGTWNPVWTDLVNKEGAGGLTSAKASEHGGTPRQSAADLPSSPKNNNSRPWSPMSARSKLTKATVYPPLPESRFGDFDDGPSSPTSKSRARSKAASISPSDSPTAQGQRVQLFASPKQPLQAFGSVNGNGNGSRSPPPGSPMSGHQSRPFSPYRHAPTQEDLLNAAVRGRALVIPQEPPLEKEPSVASSKTPSKAPSKAPSSKVQSPQSRAMSQMEGGRPPSSVSSRMSRASRAEQQQQDRNQTPTPRSPVRTHSPEGFDPLDPEEARIVNEALARTPRTSVYAAPLEEDVAGHYHDMELCVLLHQENDPNQHEFVKKALRKAVRQRIRKLGMKYDHESIKQYRKSYHDHDPSVHLRQDYTSDDTPPQWAADLKREMVLMQQRIESLGPKIENLKIGERERSYVGGAGANGSRFAYEPDESTGTPMTQTVNIQTQPTGTLADSMYQAPETELDGEREVLLDDDGNVLQYLSHREYDEDDRTETETQRRYERHHHPHTDGETRSAPRSMYGMSEVGRDDSPGQQYLEEELYKLRQKTQGSQLSHKSWEVAHHDIDDGEVYDEGVGVPTIPDMNGETEGEGEGEGEGGYRDERSSSPPLPDLPPEAIRDREMEVRAQGPWNAVDYSGVVGDTTTLQQNQLAPWQRIHARLLNWAIIWPMPELEHALNSTTRGQQVDEVALTIWSMQAYKRYVRAKLTDAPPPHLAGGGGVSGSANGSAAAAAMAAVDRLFVPPNMADAISNAVFNGRHGEASAMLERLWAPFGFPGSPRLIVVLAKHRSDPNHWVVHRFSLPDGSLTTYDSYPERTLPDGRPLGWWFAIRVAWPNANNYPSPDHLVQKMVRLHRPLQLPIDNSVAAAGIWRNVLMGSRAERSVDLERLRDLVNTEVKNLKQRKVLGKVSVGHVGAGGGRAGWEDMS